MLFVSIEISTCSVTNPSSTYSSPARFQYASARVHSRVAPSFPRTSSTEGTAAAAADAASLTSPPPPSAVANVGMRGRPRSDDDRLR